MIGWFLRGCSQLKITDSPTQWPSIQGRGDFLDEVWNWPSLGIVVVATFFLMVPVPQPQLELHWWPRLTRGACWLRSLTAWALRVPEAIRHRLGAEITRREVRPQTGQKDGALRSSMLLKETRFSLTVMSCRMAIKIDRSLKARARDIWMLFRTQFVPS